MRIKKMRRVSPAASGGDRIPAQFVPGHRKVDAFPAYAEVYAMAVANARDNSASEVAEG